MIGDKSLSKRDFSRVIKPLRLFGVNIQSKKNSLPIKILGTDYLRPICYNERIGSAQVKSCIIFCALNTPGITQINAKKSRDHTEQLLRSLNYPIKIKTKNSFDKISIKGLGQLNDQINNKFWFIPVRKSDQDAGVGKINFIDVPNKYKFLLKSNCNYAINYFENRSFFKVLCK